MAERYFYLHTFGCQMNVHESELIAERLLLDGYQKTDDMRKADIVIVNTCSVREKAEQKAYSQIGRIASNKRTNKDLIVAIGGCLAQQEGKRFLDRAPFVDIIFGTHHHHRISEMISRFRKFRRPIVETSLQEKSQAMSIISDPGMGAVSAYVTVMQGCNNFCSFCIVPYLRGREESRDEKEILAEIINLSIHGVREVMLLGQNVNSYGKTLNNGACFSGLLKKIGEITGIERIRFTTSHPRDLSDDIVGCFGSVRSLCEHIHLPLQSGSDRILNLMNRNYTRKEYLEKVQKLRKASPVISITSDVIVGYPGETEQDFRDTLDVMDEVKFDGLFSFKYSDRRGTAAANHADKVREEVKNERLLKLQSLQETYTLEKNKGTEGTLEEVLVEGISKNSLRDLKGRTRTNKIVNFTGDQELIGRILNVRIKKAYVHSLRGELA